MTWHRMVKAGALAGAPIVVALHGVREGVRGIATAAPVAVAGEVTGTVTLLGASNQVRDAVVYLEPINDEARVVAAPRPAPAAARPTVALAPRDSTRLLWGAVRELGAVTRDLRDRVAELRSGGPVRTAAAPPRTPSLAVIDSAARGDVAAAAPLLPPPDPAAEATRRAAAQAAAQATAAAATREEILMRQKTFLPHVRVIPAGGTVAWPNRDPFSHNVFSNTPGGTFDLGLYPRGESRGAAFRRPGIYPVFCNIHPRMSAYVVAVPAPYYAQPGAGGRFTIAGVPPGRYRLRAWHERAGTTPARVVTVAGGGGSASGLDVTLDAREFRPQPHANKFGQPYARTARDEY